MYLKSNGPWYLPVYLARLHSYSYSRKAMAMLVEDQLEVAEDWSRVGIPEGDRVLTRKGSQSIKRAMRTRYGDCTE